MVQTIQQFYSQRFRGRLDFVSLAFSSFVRIVPRSYFIISSRRVYSFYLDFHGEKWRFKFDELIGRDYAGDC